MKVGFRESEIRRIEEGQAMAVGLAATDEHPVKEVLPLGQMFIYGLQHVLSMYAGVVAVPLIVGTAFRTAGRPAEEIRASLENRLGTDEETRRSIVADQLREIALLRLAGMVAP
jgi:hypothetical protein